MGYTADRVERICKRGGHAETLSAAAGQGPEEVGLDLSGLAVRIVPSAVTTSTERRPIDRRAVPSHQPSDPTAERDPGDPDGAGVAERDRESLPSTPPTSTHRR